MSTIGKASNRRQHGGSEWLFKMDSMMRESKKVPMLAVALLWWVASVHAAVADDAAQFAQWQPEIDAFVASDRQSPPKLGAIVFVGSSSIRRWSGLADDFPNVAVLNRGFGGSQLPDVTHFADQIVIPYRPLKIVVYAGDNDLAAGHSPQQVLTDFKAFVARVRRDLPNVPVAYISIKPSPGRQHLLTQMQAANDAIKQYAASQKLLDYIDVYTPMLNGGTPRGELFTADGLHMNRAGYELWKAIIAPYLEH